MEKNQRIKVKSEFTEQELRAIIREEMFEIVKELLSVKQEVKQGYSQGFKSSVTYNEV